MMFLVVPTIEEVISDFWTWAFTSATMTTYEDLFTLINMYITFVIVFSLVLIPLYRIATFWLRKKYRR